MVYMFSFAANMFYNYCDLKINPFGMKIMSYVTILHAFLVRRKNSLASGISTVSHIFAQLSS